MSTTSENATFVFDANFFISLKQIKAKSPIQQLRAAKVDLKINFYISQRVFDELPFVVGSGKQLFEKAIDIKSVSDTELKSVKNDLTRKGVRLLAQDPDLSLVALGQSLKHGTNVVYIVSDDFKLSQNIDTLGYRMKCLPLPAFIQFLGSNLKGSKSHYWKIARKKILQLNLDFMMKRSNIYAPQAKIAWLIENAVSVAHEGIQLNDQNIKKEPLETKEYPNNIEGKIKIINEYIRGRKIIESQKKKISQFIEALDVIKVGRKIITSAKNSLMKSDYRSSLRHLRKVNELLNNKFQIMGAKLSQDDYIVFERFMASEIAKVIFIRSFVLIENNKVTSALSSLDQTAFFSTMAHLPETVLTINYLKGLLFLFNSFYNRALNQFKFNYKLAESLKIKKSLADTLKLKAIIGSSITNFLIDQQDEAIEQVHKAVKNITPKMLPSLMIALTDSGDYFLALGFPEIASNLYSEALECAIDSGRKWRYSPLISKMKKAYLASSLIGTETRPSGDISVLIDKFHEIKNVDKYNEMMAKLVMFVNKFYEPFTFFSEGKKKLTPYDNLPHDFKQDWDCVKTQENPDTGRTLLIAFKEEIGLIAFDVLLDTNLEGVPENYTIRLKKTAKIRIDHPDVIKETLFLIRASIKIGNEDRDLEIVRKIPVFFKQMA